MQQLCPKCGGQIFTLQDIEIENSLYSFVSVQCKLCGTSIGVTNFENVPATIIKFGKEIESKIDSLLKRIEELEKR